MNITLITTLPETPIQHIQFVENLAQQMGKNFTVETSFIASPSKDVFAMRLPSRDSIHGVSHPIRSKKNSNAERNWEDYVAQNNVDMMFISCKNNRRTILKYLKACRNLRIPYGFITDTMRKINNIQHILMPVSMLQEDVHKANIATNIAKATKANTIILQANDYGTKAIQNVQKISKIYDKLNLPYKINIAKKNSFGIIKETAKQHYQLKANINIITATREYALDDIIFGPTELYAIKHSNIPIILINPRNDLYTLCN